MVECISVQELVEYWRKVGNNEATEVYDLAELPAWPDICADLNWRTSSVNGGYFSEKRHGFYGVYRISVLVEGGHQPLPINRAGGVDETGTLYIGKSDSLHRRMNQLRLGTHEFWTILRKLPMHNYPSARIALSYYFTMQYPRFVERTLLRSYLKTFGDLPPLNFSL